MTYVIGGGAAMEYDDYEEIFQIAALEGVRGSEDKISEQEWMLLATITQQQVVQRIRGDLREKTTFYAPVISRREISPPRP